LLIEDEAALRRAIPKAFRSHAVEVVAVADLDSALRVSLDDIDAILADVCVGARLVHEIVPNLVAAEPLVPIVAFTGQATFEHGFTLRELGVSRCVTKPADPGHLVEILEAAARSLAGGTPDRFAEFRKLRPRALRRLIGDALAQSDGRVTAAARLLGYSRSAVQHWMRHLGIRGS
jgi:DNA-binding NtrC family response regulator